MTNSNQPLSTGCLPVLKVTFDCFCVHVISDKDLSNVVLLFSGNVTQKYDNLTGLTGTFCGTGDNFNSFLLGAWVKSGCNQSGDCPGCGEFFASSVDFTKCDPCGCAGPQGSQGFQGSIGNQGPQGAKGEVGNQGSQGKQGVQGSNGDRGPQGFQGSKGENGSNGTQGVQGTTGIGTQGNLGPQGYTGPQGFQGLFGPQGYQGLPFTTRAVVTYNWSDDGCCSMDSFFQVAGGTSNTFGYVMPFAGSIVAISYSVGKVPPLGFAALIQFLVNGSAVANLDLTNASPLTGYNSSLAIPFAQGDTLNVNSVPDGILPYYAAKSVIISAIIVFNA